MAASGPADEAAERLHVRRASTAASVAALERDLAALHAASADSNADDEHDPEGATIGFERAQLDAALAVARERLTGLDAAIARSEQGRGGLCEACGRPIPAARLEARPEATRCVPCAA